MYRETLLTYRLIFGQSYESRKITSGLIDGASSEMGGRVSDGGDGVDEFLRTLCTTPLYTQWSLLGLPFGRRSGPHITGELFPISSLSVHNDLIESSSYSARDDFPTFGHRLLALQRYNSRHQPSKITDLWRDRRNLLQWYTFWAVLLVGGLGLLLATLQLIVGIIQVIYASNPGVERRRQSHRYKYE